MSHHTLCRGQGQHRAAAAAGSRRRAHIACCCSVALLRRRYAPAAPSGRRSTGRAQQKKKKKKRSASHILPYRNIKEIERKFLDESATVTKINIVQNVENKIDESESESSDGEN